MNADCCPCSKFTDTDSDGVMDLTDPDSDADGSPDAEEGTGDSDSDGVPDVLQGDKGACCSCKPKLGGDSLDLGRLRRARRLASKDGLEEGAGARRKLGEDAGLLEVDRASGTMLKV